MSQQQKKQMQPVEGEVLPKAAVNLARRAVSLARRGDGRYKLELVFINGHWALIVENGKLERLG